MFSVLDGNRVRGMWRAGVIGGIALIFFGYCLLTGNDDVLRGRPSRAARAARADFDHDTHSDGCFTVPSTVGAHDSVEVFIRAASSDQTIPHSISVLITERIAVPAPEFTNDLVAPAANPSPEFQVLRPNNSRGPPRA